MSWHGARTQPVGTIGLQKIVRTSLATSRLRRINVPPLVVTPAPRPKESLLGYVLRVSEANGYETPTWLFSRAQFSMVAVMSGGISIGDLAILLGRQAAELQDLQYFELGGGRMLLGRAVQRVDLRLRAPRFCPECVAEKGMLDAHWDCSLVTACPTHCSSLLEQCLHCHRPLSWFRPGLLQCACGGKLVQARELVGVPATQLELNRMVVTAICGEAYVCDGLEVADLKMLLRVIRKKSGYKTARTCAVTPRKLRA